MVDQPIIESTSSLLKIKINKLYERIYILKVTVYIQVYSYLHQKVINPCGISYIKLTYQQ